jgi:hypothetical protein
MVTNASFAENRAMNPHRARPVVAALTSAVLLGAAIVQPAEAASPPIDGVWQTDGYGMVIAVDNQKARLYDVTSISCLPSFEAVRAGPDTFQGEGFSFTLRSGAMKVDLAAGPYRVRRLPRLPARCDQSQPSDPLRTFDVFWQTFAENYPFFRAKGVDWSAVRAKYRPKVRAGMTDDQLFELLVAMIEPLGDAHTALRSETRSFEGLRRGTVAPSRTLEAKVRAFIEQRDLQGRSLTEYGNGHLQYAELPGRIGYLRVNAFTDYDAADLDRALDVIFARPLNGLVLDLRVNVGGIDPLALRLLSRLIDRPQLAYLKRARDSATDPARFTRPEPVVVQPANTSRYAGPIAVLTGGSTVSAGETFTQALMGRSPQPIRIGQPTQGVFSDTLQRLLPNGWRLYLPNEEYRTPAWKTYDGPGIPPNVTVPVFTTTEFRTGRDSAFDAALAGLSRR